LEEFEIATSHATAPGLNISWVNNSGDIAWWVLGRFPKLPDGVPYDLVLDGWSGKNEIERYYEHKENPHEVNPESGVIITANYRPQLKEFEHFDGYWQPGGRYFRIEKLLSEKEIWNISGLKRIQTDSFVPIYDQLKDVVLVHLKDLKGTSLELNALKVLNKWNGEAVKSSVGSSIYHHFLFYVQENIFKDEMGEDLYTRFGNTADVWHGMKALFYEGSHPFWDDINTDRVENSQDIIVKSFKQAILKLKIERGSNLKNWNWGSFHDVVYEHPLGKLKPLNLIFNIGPIQADGGRYTINNLGHKRSSSNFNVKHGPATRRIIDMKNPREAYGIIPTGNSGNFLSPHFSDQSKIYHRGGYRNQSMDWSLIERLEKLTLE
jgi:penicillin amidase